MYLPPVSIIKESALVTLTDIKLLYELSNSSIAVVLSVNLVVITSLIFLPKPALFNTLLIGHFSQRYRDHDLILNETKTVFTKAMIAEQGITINFSDL